MMGDFGNVLSDQFGQVNQRTADRHASINSGDIRDILGRSLVVSSYSIDEK